MRVALVVAALALIACTFVAAQSAEVAPRFAEAEAEDQAVLAEQQKSFEESLDAAQIDASEEAEDEAEAESEDESEAEAEDEAEEESEEEAEEESEDESEEESEEEAEDEEEADEESEEEDESEDESEEEESESAEFVLAELSDNAVNTGFMEMTATFKPVEPVAAHHVVHSLSSHQQAVAQQEYSVGYAHGHADAQAAPVADAEDAEDEAAFVEANAESETEAEADAEHAPIQYIASNGQPYYASYPAHTASVQPYYGGVPMPPQLPTWLPPPPYITPVAPKGGDDG